MGEFANKSLEELTKAIRETSDEVTRARTVKSEADRELNRLECRLTNLRAEFTRTAASSNMLDRTTLESIPSMRSTGMSAA